MSAASGGTLHVVGLGLGDERDITLRGLDVVRRCGTVFLEHYTSILGTDDAHIERMESLYGCKLILADREMVEERADTILDAAARPGSAAAFLVVGDPFAATTHTDLVLRARARGIRVDVVHNASIVNAVAACGLQLYRFGETVSVVFFTPTWRPGSFYDRIQRNRAAGLHTLCLLDIKVREPTLESLARGKPVYEPPRFMTVAQCAAQLVEVEAARREGAYAPDTPCVGLARVGAATQAIVSAPLRDLAAADGVAAARLGGPLHALVVCGEPLHELEREMLAAWSL